MSRICNGLLFLTIFLCSGILFLSPSVLAVDHSKDSLEDIKARMKNKTAIMIDVREQAEWDKGHLKDAYLVPLSKIDGGAELKEFVKDLKKDTIVYCHCLAGRRSLSAAEKLLKQGYDVRPLKQGYEELLKNGFEKSGK